MFNNKYLFKFLAVLSVLVGFSANALAATQDVGASLSARQALSLSNVQDMNFGNVEFAATHSGVIRLATNSVTTLSAGVGLTLSGTPAAGSVDVSSDGVSPMEISCTTEGVLANGASTITLSNPQIVTGAGVGYGLGTSCAGIGASPLVSTGATVVRIGGEIDVTGNLLESGAYSTASAGGNPVTISVVYQ